MNETVYVLAGVVLGLTLAILIAEVAEWRRRNPRWLRAIRKSIKENDRALEALRRAVARG